MDYVQLLTQLGKQYHQDILSLNAGDRWARKLHRLIDESDAVLLFWSSNAKASKWVIRECKYAIKKKGHEHLLPIIIEGPPPATPPRALKHIHFNNPLTYFKSPDD